MIAEKTLNQTLHIAKSAKKDEFYTQLSDIESELKHYEKHFKNKVVFCNCDDPRNSNFFNYFAYNFEKLGLKKLITTCYKNQETDLFIQEEAEKAVFLEYTGDKNGNKIPDAEEIGIIPLKGDGDFRSKECIELLKQADIVVTNPPFSLFREYVAQLVEHKKKFVIIGNLNALTYRDIFKLIKEDKLWFCGVIVIAANAGGAWSPLGDVTTTMLWIGGQITALNIMKQLILPSLVVCAIPTLIVWFRFRGQQIEKITIPESSADEKKDGKIILFAGIGFLVFVPVFKTLTHLPPFMGMLLALGLMWVITTLLHKSKDPELAEKFNVAKALQKVDSPSILFFLGILLAVSALQSAGLLREGATWLSDKLGNTYLIGSVLGLLSALVDNVPLVAASQGMYDLQTYPTDHPFWEFLALTTGTGGSAVIIGSAAGVAVMGIEKIDFMWYLRKISWLALAGFAGGIAVFLLQQQF